MFIIYKVSHLFFHCMIQQVVVPVVGFIPRIALFEEHTLENTANQESRCILDGITPNLPIMRRAYVRLFVLATVFPMAWYKNVMQRFCVVCQFYFPFVACNFLSCTRLKVTRDVFHVIIQTRVKYCHENIKFISSRHRVISSMYTTRKRCVTNILLALCDTNSLQDVNVHVKFELQFSEQR